MIPDSSAARALLKLAIDALNEAFTNDPDAVQALCCVRIPCNEALAQHPTVQVSKEGIAPDSKGWTVGAIGIINGLVEPMTGLRISTDWSKPNEFDQVKLLGFKIYDPKAHVGLAIVEEV